MPQQFWRPCSLQTVPADSSQWRKYPHHGTIDPKVVVPNISRDFVMISGPTLRASSCFEMLRASQSLFLAIPTWLSKHKEELRSRRFWNVSILHRCA